jgi:hypothetical protein
MVAVAQQAESAGLWIRRSRVRTPSVTLYRRLGNQSRDVSSAA